MNLTHHQSIFVFSFFCDQFMYVEEVWMNFQTCGRLSWCKLNCYFFLCVLQQTRNQHPGHAEHYASCLGEDEFQLAGPRALPLDPHCPSYFLWQGFQLSVHHLSLIFDYLFSVFWRLVKSSCYEGNRKNVIKNFYFLMFLFCFCFYICRCCYCVCVGLHLLVGLFGVIIKTDIV